VDAVNAADHIGLVYHVAKRFNRRNESFDDLVQAGVFGLIKAAESYDPSRGCFSTLACCKIRTYIARYLRDCTRIIHIPHHVRSGVTKPVECPGTVVASLDAPIDEFSTLHDRCGDGTPSSEEQIEEAEISRLIWAHVDKLKEPYREVIHLRYRDGMTLQQIGDRFGRTRERMRQIEEQALAMLRKRVKL